MEEKFIKCFTNYDLTDVLGFAKILNVEEKEDFTDFMTDIVAAFSEKNRKDKRSLLKLAKNIHENNKNCEKRKLWAPRDENVG